MSFQISCEIIMKTIQNQNSFSYFNAPIPNGDGYKVIGFCHSDGYISIYLNRTILTTRSYFYFLFPFFLSFVGIKTWILLAIMIGCAAVVGGWISSRWHSNTNTSNLYSRPRVRGEFMAHQRITRLFLGCWSVSLRGTWRGDCSSFVCNYYSSTCGQGSRHSLKGGRFL